MGAETESLLISFDPGDDTGHATWIDSVLVMCGLVHPAQYCDLPFITLFDSHFAAKKTVLIEEPQIYRQSLQKCDPNDMVTLALKVGEIGMAFKLTSWARGRSFEYERVKPREWKGQRDKPICHAQMLPKLTAVERQNLELGCIGISKSQVLDVKDAVCLGLWRLKRAR